MQTSILWFRRDLRVTDNPALVAALAASERVVPVYIHAPDEEAAGAPGGASRWWLHHGLEALAATLARLGSPLIIRHGPSATTLLGLAREVGAGAVHWNRLYEPAAIARDTRLKAELKEAGLEVTSHNGSLLVEPWDVRTGAGDPYRVYTPFWRQCQPRLDHLPAPLAAPRQLRGPARPVASLVPADLRLLPRLPWSAGLASAWKVGENAALDALEDFVAERIDRYKEARDFPAVTATARISPHLHFGELSPRQAVAAALAAGASTKRRAGAAGREHFLKELVWREFAYHLLYHYPHTIEEPLDSRYRDMPWADNPNALGAWQRGETGIPMVDAGMRELWTTGWMHNRVRMLVGSLLCKNLGIHWRSGAAWFHDTLVDADLAANTLGWQWTAGCGADAAPYYRIFSPVLQAERFDPSRAYLRRWLPELARLPDEWIHRPFEASDAVLAAAGVRLGRDYPTPVVDLKASRVAALEAYASMRGEGSVNPRRGGGRNAKQEPG